jgi:hypothetical protein
VCCSPTSAITYTAATITSPASTITYTAATITSSASTITYTAATITSPTAINSISNLPYFQWKRICAF